MIGTAFTTIAVAIFLALHFPISRWIARALVIPAVQAESPRRFQFSLVDWLALIVILQGVFALTGPLHDWPKTRMASWIGLAYCFGSVTLCWWASVPELTKGDVQRPILRFVWLLCLVPVNAMQTLVVAWFSLAFVASVFVLVIGGAAVVISSFPIASVLVAVAVAGIVLFRRKAHTRRHGLPPASGAKRPAIFEGSDTDEKPAPHEFLRHLKLDMSIVEPTGTEISSSIIRNDGQPNEPAGRR